MAQQWLNRPGLRKRSYKSNHQPGKSITVMEKKDWKVPAFARQTGNGRPRQACCRALSSWEAWRGHSIAEADDRQWASCPEDRNRKLEQRKRSSTAGHRRLQTSQDAFKDTPPPKCQGPLYLSIHCMLWLKSLLRICSLGGGGNTPDIVNLKHLNQQRSLINQSQLCGQSICAVTSSMMDSSTGHSVKLFNQTQNVTAQRCSLCSSVAAHWFCHLPNTTAAFFRLVYGQK